MIPAKRLDEQDLLADPMAQFALWYDEALCCPGIDFANAMCLSTIGEDGYPQGRIVLLKGFSAEGFVFYTNTQSAKGQALARTPRAALTFYWDPLGRQVRAQGDTSFVDDATADAYFASRDRMSQIGAWASAQSEPLADRAELERRAARFRDKFGDGPVPRPPHWTGYRLAPKRVELWQFGEHRLHDRFLYEWTNGSWLVRRLNP